MEKIIQNYTDKLTTKLEQRYGKKDYHTSQEACEALDIITGRFYDVMRKGLIHPYVDICEKILDGVSQDSLSLYVAGYIFRLKDRTGIGERMANLRSAFTAFETMHLGLRSHFLHLTADIQGTIETYASSIYEQGWFITTARDFDGRRAYQFSVHGNGVKHMSLELVGGSTPEHYRESIRHKRGVVIRSPDIAHALDSASVVLPLFAYCYLNHLGYHVGKQSRPVLKLRQPIDFKNIF